MSEAAVGTAVGLAVGLLGGIVLTVLGAILVVRFQRQRRQLGYEILSANVIIPRLARPNPAVQILVKESVLDTGHDDPRDLAVVPVDEVFGFRIRIRNAGNGELVKQSVTFQFPPGAKVILADLEALPEFGGISPATDIDNSRSRVTVTLPFLNENQEAIVSIQTLYNQDLSCKVIAAAPGLYSFDMRRRRLVLLEVACGLVIALVTVPGLVLFGLSVFGAIPEAVHEEVAAAAMYMVMLSLLAVALLFVALAGLKERA